MPLDQSARERLSYKFFFFAACSIELLPELVIAFYFAGTAVT